MKVGRKRTLRHDLPPGLRFDPTWETYHYRATRGGERLYVPFGKISREAAIKAYWKIVGPQKDEPAAGTVGELIDRYLHDELPRRQRVGKMKAITATEYERIGPALRKALARSNWRARPRNRAATTFYARSTWINTSASVRARVAPSRPIAKSRCCRRCSPSAAESA